MKLIEWGFRKNKFSSHGRLTKKSSTTLRQSTPASPREGTSAPRENLALPSRSLEQEDDLQKAHTQQINEAFTQPVIDANWKFLTSRTDKESLEILTRTNTWYTRRFALEILLISWKSGTEYMACAYTLLHHKVCCESILYYLVPDHPTSVPRQTIFDLMEAKVPPYQQASLMKNILKANMYTRSFCDYNHPLWAPIWRAACDSQKWKDAIYHLAELEYSKPLFNAAFAVIAERYLRQHQVNIGKPTGLEVFPIWDHNQYLRILSDCRKYQVEIDSSWYFCLLDILDAGQLQG